MKNRLLQSTIFLFLVFSASLLSAADSQWDNLVVTGNFDNDGNWDNNAPGATSGTTNPDTATFEVTSDTTVTVDVYRNLANLVLQSANDTSVTLTSGTLHLTDGGVISRATGGNANSSGIVNSDILLYGNYSFTNSTSGFLGFGLSGTPTIAGTAGVSATQTLTLNGTSANTSNEIASLLSDGVNGGSLALQKTGSAIWTLSNSGNSYSGGTVFGTTGVFNANFGELRVTASGALGSGQLTINGISNVSGGLRLDGASAPGGGITLNNAIRNENFRFGSAHIENLSGDNELSGLTSITGSTTESQPDRRTLYVRSTGGSLLISGNITTTGTGGSRRNLYINTDGGDVSISGIIGGGTRTIHLNKIIGSDTLTLTGDNTYTGLNTLSAGTTLVNNTTGSGTGTGAVSVLNAGTVLGGSGTVAGNTTMGVGTVLSPGAAAGAAGTLTFGGDLDISGLADGSGNSLLFQLGAPVASDRVVLDSGALSIGSGLLDLDDFSFTALAGFAPGTYTLFETTQAISGTLGSSLTGTLDGQDVELGFANGNQNLVLTVIPEPSTLTLVLGGIILFVLQGLKQRRHQH